MDFQQRIALAVTKNPTLFPAGEDRTTFDVKHDDACPRSLKNEKPALECECIPVITAEGKGKRYSIGLHGEMDFQEHYS